MKVPERIKEVARSIEVAQAQLASLTPRQRAALEKEWDVEHAYYSSTLEGSDTDRSEFDTLGEKIA